MFDWNDEELTNIIWDEAGENDDHIVPYPNRLEEKRPLLFGDLTKKETNQQFSNISSAELKKSVVKSEPGVELDGCSKYDVDKSTTGFCVEPWPDAPAPSSSNATKDHVESLGTPMTNSLTKCSKNSSSRDETPQFNKDSAIFENTHEDGEQDDFVDYGWANIGSFDDLDRIFSNNDPIFGDISVGNADELWPSSKDITSSPTVPTPLTGDSSDSPLDALRASADQSTIKAQYAQDRGRFFASGYDNSHTPQDVQASIDNIEHSGGKSNILLKEKTFVTGAKVPTSHKQLYDGTAAAYNDIPDKGNRQQKRQPKGHRLDKKSEAKQMHNLPGTWASPRSSLQQINNPYPPLMVSPSTPLVLTQQRPLQMPDPFQPKHFTGAPLVPPLHGNIPNPYSTTPALAQFHPGEGSCELAHPGYEVPPANGNPLKNLEDAAVKPPPMTPKEKIEKLRRRQQLRAMLAIQKQQLQFGNQLSVSDHSSIEGGKIELDDSLSSFPSLEMSSPTVEQDDSNTTGMVCDNRSMEESVLFRLQDTIANLDVGMRLCIRDSLYRLAQSAMQRQYPQDTSCASTTTRDDTLSNKDNASNERMADVETDTNPIDRTVAHLLFHRPLEFSGKSADTPESPLSANITYDTKANLLKSLAKGYLSENLDNSQIPSPQGSKSTGMFSERDQSKNISPFAHPDNTSKNDNTDRADMKGATSK